MKYILCVYTSKKKEYSSAREQLQNHQSFKDLVNDEEVDIYYIYADEHIKKPVLEGNALYVPCKDDYVHLAKKTFEMFSFFSSYSFDYIIKLDDTILQKKWELEARKSIHKGIKSICKGLYSGAMITVFSKRYSDDWINLKKLKKITNTDYYGALYYTGKCYCLSKDACMTVTEKGAMYSKIMIESLSGIEDLMVGVILKNHLLKKTDLWRMKMLYIYRKLSRLLFLIKRTVS